MFRFLLGSIFFCFALYPQVASCGTAKKADKTVSLDELPSKKSLQFEEVERFKLDYGEDVDTTYGFQPGVNETNKLAPNAFEVKKDGTILVADPVHKKIFSLKRARDGRIILSVVDSYKYDRLPGVKHKSSKNKNVSVKKTGADTADIIFDSNTAPKTVRLKIKGPLASVRLIGVNKGGDAFVVVERFVKLGSLAVEREVLVVSSNGETRARLKIDDVPFVPPVVEFQLAPDGSLYRMIPGDESVTFVRWEVR